MIFILTGKAAPGRLRETLATRSVVVLVMERARVRDRNVGSSENTADVIVLNGSIGRLPGGLGATRLGAAAGTRS